MRYAILTFLTALALGATAQRATYRHDGPALLPDSAVSPGATNPSVTQATIQKTACVSGWTKTVRPPDSKTDKQKLAIMAIYGDTRPQLPKLALVRKRAKNGSLQKKGSWDVAKCVAFSDDPNCYELDHLISLQLGGAPDDARNLWPEPYWPEPGARQKDVVETWLKRQVCAGKMPLAEAQREIGGDWYAVFQKIAGKARK